MTRHRPAPPARGPLDSVALLDPVRVAEGDGRPGLQWASSVHHRHVQRPLLMGDARHRHGRRFLPRTSIRGDYPTSVPGEPVGMEWLCDEHRIDGIRSQIRKPADLGGSVTRDHEICSTVQSLSRTDHRSWPATGPGRPRRDVSAVLFPPAGQRAHIFIRPTARG